MLTGCGATAPAAVPALGLPRALSFGPWSQSCWSWAGARWARRSLSGPPERRLGRSRGRGGDRGVAGTPAPADGAGRPGGRYPGLEVRAGELPAEVTAAVCRRETARRRNVCRGLAAAAAAGCCRSRPGIEPRTSEHGAERVRRRPGHAQHGRLRGRSGHRDQRRRLSAGTGRHRVGRRHHGVGRHWWSRSPSTSSTPSPGCRGRGRPTFSWWSRP